MEKLGVEVRLNTEVKEIESFGSDPVIIATGSTPRVLKKVPGHEKMLEACEYLLGAPVGEKIAVVGGGLTGCEIAYELALQGKDVYDRRDEGRSGVPEGRLPGQQFVSARVVRVEAGSRLSGNDAPRGQRRLHRLRRRRTAPPSRSRATPSFPPPAISPRRLWRRRATRTSSSSATACASETSAPSSGAHTRRQ